jgi:hypothetical protein
MNHDSFLRQHAAEIAEALQKQEDENNKNYESIDDLYRSLCFDEPLVQGERYISSLIRLLTKGDEYALSDRLVNGIMYLCRQTQTQNKNMTKLAFCVLVQIPLLVLENLDKNFAMVQRLLGSYKGHFTPKNNNQNNTSASASARIEQRVDQLSQAIHNASILEEEVDTNHGQDSSQEVWAAESDPSDYDYGEGAATVEPISYFQDDDDDWLSPKQLSKADYTLTPQQARLSTLSLLGHLQYTLMEPLFGNKTKKELEDFTYPLTQLILTLLQPSSPLLKLRDEEAQDSILSPLWVLRDAAMTSSQNDLTSVYLDVLQTLLAMDEAHLQDLGGTFSSSTTTTTRLATASIVGFGALSSWCTEDLSLSKKKTTTACVLDTMNDIANVIERACLQEEYQPNVAHSLIPIMELLSGITYAIATPAHNNNSVAQTFLNSGLLRLLLGLLVVSKNPENQSVFHHALWGLAVSNLKLIGKYVARYPGIPQFLRSRIEGPRGLVHCILWNGFGYISSMETLTPRVIWKNNKASTTTNELPLTRDECQQACSKAWTHLLQLVVDLLVESHQQQQQSILDEWERLFAMISIDTMSTTFLKLLDSTQLEIVANALIKCKELPNEEIEKSLEQQEQQQDEEDPDDKLKPLKNCASTKQNRARKLLKEYTLYFQQQGSIRGSSKTD